MNTPIAVFAFNRPDHLRRTLTALSYNELAEQTDVTIFCDGPRNDDDLAMTIKVREIASSIQGFASVQVVARNSNLGCANSLIQGLAEMFAVHERLIIIEDDILTSPYTLRYFNTCLDRYASESTVFNIAAWSPPPNLFRIHSSYPYDVYAAPRFVGWGWATWKDRWERIDWDVLDYEMFQNNPTLLKAYSKGGEDLGPMLAAQMSGKLDTWDIRMDYARFKHGCVGINPVYSYTTNIGNDGSGVHCDATSIFDNDVSRALPVCNLMDHIFCDENILNSYSSVYSFKIKLHIRIINKLFRIITGKNIIPV